MKKYLALLLAVLMVLTALAGCSSQQAETTTPDAPAAATGNTPETETPDTQPDETTTSGEKTKISFMGWGTDAEIATYSLRQRIPTLRSNISSLPTMNLTRSSRP